MISSVDVCFYVQFAFVQIARFFFFFLMIFIAIFDSACYTENVFCDISDNVCPKYSRKY